MDRDFWRFNVIPWVLATIVRFVELAVLGGLLVALGWIAREDIRSRRIPNRATYPMILLGLLWGLGSSFVTHRLFPVQSLLDALLGCLICFAIMFVIYVYTNSGAGDVKLAAGIGSFLGVKGGFLAICYTYITAACFAGCLILWMFGFGFAARGLLRTLGIWTAPEPEAVQLKVAELLSRGLPLAPFFLIGTTLVLLEFMGFFRDWDAL